MWFELPLFYATEPATRIPRAMKFMYKDRAPCMVSRIVRVHRTGAEACKYLHSVKVDFTHLSVLQSACN
jgi:hypothetical protein